MMVVPINAREFEARFHARLTFVNHHALRREVVLVSVDNWVFAFWEPTSGLSPCQMFLEEANGAPLPDLVEIEHWPKAWRVTLALQAQDLWLANKMHERAQLEST